MSFGARVGVTLFLMIFVGVGLSMVWSGISSVTRNRLARRWPEVDCTITRSEVAEYGKHDRPYKFEVAYTYNYAGREHKSDRYSSDHSATDDYAREERLHRKYFVGANAVCRVNPSNPDEAFLAESSTSSNLLAIPFGAVFALFGLVPILAIWRRKPSQPPPLSAAGISSRGWIGGMIFFLLFAIAGAAIAWFGFIRPVWRGREAAASWQRTPCTVVSSRVLSHSGGDSTTYSVDILYRYQVAGQEYESNRHDFFGASSSGYDAKSRLVAQYPRGRKTVCYVNPADPVDAVLDPHATFAMWWMILPLVFLAVGIVGAIAVLRRTARQRALGTLPFPQQGIVQMGGRQMYSGPVVPEASSAPLVLRASQKPLTAFLAALVFALLFGGVFIFVLRHVMAGSISGKGFLSVWLTFWGLGTVGITLAAIRSAMSLFNPRVELTAEHGTVPPGGSMEFQWTMSGRYDRVQRFTIRLEGREEATYRRGTSTYTDKKTFARFDLLDTTHNYEIQAGKGRLTIPAGAMHSFRSNHNKVTWQFVVHGEIANWPDLKAEFELPVPPAPAVPSRAAVRGDAPAVADSELGIDFVGGRTHFVPGDTISGVASWKLPAPARSVEVRLFWYTRGKGTVDVQVVDRVRFESPSGHDRRPFKFQAPSGPWSFSGTLVSLVWAIEVVAEPKDRTQRTDIVIAPGGVEITLPALAPTESRP